MATRNTEKIEQRQRQKTERQEFIKDVKQNTAWFRRLYFNLSEFMMEIWENRAVSICADILVMTVFLIAGGVITLAGIGGYFLYLSGSTIQERISTGINPAVALQQTAFANPTSPPSTTIPEPRKENKK